MAHSHQCQIGKQNAKIYETVIHRSFTVFFRLFVSVCVCVCARDALSALFCFHKMKTKQKRFPCLLLFYIWRGPSKRKHSTQGGERERERQKRVKL